LAACGSGDEQEPQATQSALPGQTERQFGDPRRPDCIEDADLAFRTGVEFSALSIGFHDGYQYVAGDEDEGIRRVSLNGGEPEQVYAYPNEKTDGVLFLADVIAVAQEDGAVSVLDYSGNVLQSWAGTADPRIDSVLDDVAGTVGFVTTATAAGDLTLRYEVVDLATGARTSVGPATLTVPEDDFGMRSRIFDGALWISWGAGHVYRMDLGNGKATRVDPPPADVAQVYAFKGVSHGFSYWSRDFPTLRAANAAEGDGTPTTLRVPVSGGAAQEVTTFHDENSLFFEYHWHQGELYTVDYDALYRFRADAPEADLLRNLAGCNVGNLLSVDGRQYVEVYTQTQLNQGWLLGL
jgi:hypothetical protein